MGIAGRFRAPGRQDLARGRHWRPAVPHRAAVLHPRRRDGAGLDDQDHYRPLQRLQTLSQGAASALARRTDRSGPRYHRARAGREAGLTLMQCHALSSWPGLSRPPPLLRSRPSLVHLAPLAGLSGEGKRNSQRANALLIISRKIWRRMLLLVREASCRHQPSCSIPEAAATKRFATSAKSPSV